MNPKLIEEMSWRMAEVYGAVTDRLLINLARHFRFIAEGATPSGSWDYMVKKLAEMGQVTKESAAIIAGTLDGADEALHDVLEEAIRDGLKGVDKQLRTAAEKGLLQGQGFLQPELSINQMQAFKAYYRQSADKLNLVNTVMLESTQQAYQATVSDIVNKINVTQGILNTETGEVVTGVTSFNKAVRDGVQRMVNNGLTGFIDHGGHHWSPEAYVAMDIRTTAANASRAAVWEDMENYGDDLYCVSWHNGARPLCYPWQGKVISRSGWTGEVEDLDGNKVHVYAQSETSYGEAAGLFGINCGHYPIAFIPGFSSINEPQQNEEENAKEYEESQQQRALERKLRYEKRDLEVLKAQGASEDEIKAQRAKVKNARNELDDFCSETGRSRRTSRESAPIKAEFPDVDRFSSDISTSNNSGMSGIGRITQAQDIKEAEEFAKTFIDTSATGSVGISYDGISVETANVINNHLLKFTEDYKFDKFGGIFVPEKGTPLWSRLNGNPIAYNSYTKSFLINRETFNTIESVAENLSRQQAVVDRYLLNPSDAHAEGNVMRILEGSRKSGRAHVGQNIIDVLNHELGHALTPQIERLSGYGKVARRWAKYAEGISGEATLNIGEYIAESFSAWNKGEKLHDKELIKCFEALKR